MSPGGASQVAKSWITTYADQRPRSRGLFAQAREVIGGGVGHDLRYNPITPLYIARASGSRKWDVDGNEYIDYSMGNAALLIGHAHPTVLTAVHDVVDNGLHFGNDHPAMIAWAEIIHNLVPCAEKIRFVNSGTEGTMLALRLARAFTGHSKVLRFEGHFSGWHDYVGKGAAVPFNESVSLGIPATTLDTVVVIPADLNAAETILRADKEIAAIMLEPSGASWGTVPLTREFNRQVRALATAYRVPLIFDEVITGFRYAPNGYQGWADVIPDLCVLGKVVTGGLPGGVVAGRADIMQLFDYTGDAQHDRFARVSHQGTFNANPLSTAAGIATLNLVADGCLQDHADCMANTLRAGMECILDESHVAGYAYGESSIFHVYLEGYPGSRAQSRSDLITSDAGALKSIPPAVVSAFQRNLQIRGVDILSYTGGVTSSAHTDTDIQQTLDVFRETIHALVEDKIIGRVG